MQVKKPEGARRDKLVQALNRAAREASGLGTLFAAAVAERMGVGHSDFECIDIITLRGRMTAGELAAASGLTTGAVTGVIDRLERAGYARRERDPTDRRKVYVSILPKTLAEGMVYYGPFEQAISTLLERYSDDEIALFVDYFTRTKDVVFDQIETLKAAPRSKTKRRPPVGKRPAKT
jgi:DNA-binding MarR family transcriptional regulator